MAAATADEVQFSSPHQQSAGLVVFSPDGRLVASAAAYRLVVCEVATLEIVQIFSCADVIEHVDWSFDSIYVVCGIFKRGLAQVWSVLQPEWYCKVDEGPVGLSFVRFSPGGRHVLATADFQLRITVWSLLDRSVCYIRFPKFAKEGLAWAQHYLLDGSHDKKDERKAYVQARRFAFLLTP